MTYNKKTEMMSQKSLLRFTALFLALALLGTACSDDNSSPAADNVVFSNVSVSNVQETPMTSSSATGSLNATYEKNSNKLAYTITYTGITPTAMHFHKGEVGIAGGVEQEIAGPYTSGMTGTVTLTDAQESDLLANKWYINMHTTASPAGEIRGQVVTDKFVVFSNIALSGKEEVPANGSSSSGTFNGVYDKDMKMMTYNIAVTGISPTAMHFHKAGVGTNGDVVVPITSLTGMTAALTADQEADLIAGNYYFNAHSTSFPGGEIRGQVVTDNLVIFSNDIIDDNEVPVTGSAATGNFYGAYNKTTKVLSYVVRFTGITPTAMHFHKAAVGANGSVVVPISAPYTSGMSGSATLTAEQETDLLSGLWYINIHSTAFGAGEIRGQLIK